MPCRHGGFSFYRDSPLCSWEPSELSLLNPRSFQFEPLGHSEAATQLRGDQRRVGGSEGGPTRRA